MIYKMYLLSGIVFFILTFITIYHMEGPRIIFKKWLLRSNIVLLTHNILTILAEKATAYTYIAIIVNIIAIVYLTYQLWQYHKRL